MAKSMDAAVVTEVAKDALQPIMLLTMALTNGTNLRFALHQADIVFDGDTYEKTGGEIGEISESSTMEIGELTITLPNVTRVFSAYVAALNPTELRGATCTVIRVFGGLLDDATAFEDIWEGILDSWSLNGRKFECVIKDWIMTLFDEIPNRRCGRACPWNFGGTYCTLTANAGGGAGQYDQQTAQTADAGSTKTRLVDAARNEADDYWQFGPVTFTTGDNAGLTRYADTSDQASTYINFAVGFPSTISAGDIYTCSQRCDHTPNTCHDVFDNMLNYGGNLSVPRKSYR